MLAKFSPGSAVVWNAFLEAPLGWFKGKPKETKPFGDQPTGGLA